MPTESALRQMLRESAATRASDVDRLDVAGVIRRSRRRRLPRQVGAAGVLTLAIVGIGFGGITALRPLLPVPSTQGSAAMSDAASRPSAQSPSTGTTAESLNRCGEPLVQVAPHPLGLVLTVHFSDGPANAKRIDGTVTLTNTGMQRITGSTATMPVLTVSQAGVVLWHSNGIRNLSARFVDLSPGQSMVYPAFFVPVRCAAGAEGSLSFPSTLPPLSPGRYQVSASIALTTEGSAGTHYLISGSPATIRLY